MLFSDSVCTILFPQYQYRFPQKHQRDEDAKKTFAALFPYASSRDFFQYQKNISLKKNQVSYCLKNKIDFCSIINHLVNKESENKV